MFLSFSGGTDGEKCTSEQFQCGEKSSKNPNGGKCIPKRWQCDYHRDCENGEDEIDCRKFEITLLNRYRNKKVFSDSNNAQYNNI